MKNRPKISDIMTADPDWVHTAQPISEVYDMFQQNDYHHVPVLDGRRPVGMISATDILSLAYDIDSGDDRMLRTFLDIQFNIEDAMSSKLVTVTTDAKVREVADAMSSGSIHSVLVVDGEGNLEGIVTSTDLIRLLGELL